jgi:hypothetical protein
MYHKTLFSLKIYFEYSLKSPINLVITVGLSASSDATINYFFRSQEKTKLDESRIDRSPTEKLHQQIE